MADFGTALAMPLASGFGAARGVFRTAVLILGAALGPVAIGAGAAAFDTPGLALAAFGPVFLRPTTVDMTDFGGAPAVPAFTLAIIALPTLETEAV
jgi:hypothetical protein